jgi:tetratricopeptide (TPR) repeat protein
VKPVRLIILATAVTALLGAAWAWRTASVWRASIPWPEHAMLPERAWTEPLRTAHTAAARWPVRREAVERLALLYLANGFDAEAAALLPGTIERRPGAPEWVHRRAVLLAAEGRLDEAVALWQEILPAARDHLPVRVKLADALVKLNREAEAVAVYQEILVDHPGYPYAWYGLIRLDLQHQRWEDARTKLRVALAAAPDFYGHHALNAAVAQHYGDASAAAEADRNIKRLGRFRDVPDTWMEPALADCYDPYRLRVDADRIRTEAEIVGAANGLERALERLDRAIALAPTDAMNYQLLATIHGIRGDDAAARRAYEKGLELDPRSVTLYIRFANQLHRQGDDGAVLELLTRASVHCPEDADIALMLADQSAQAGRWGQAAAMYRRVVDLRPDLPDIAPQAAMAYFRSGDEPAGVAMLQENLQRHPGHEVTLGYLVMNAVHRGNAAEARDLLRRLQAVAPEAPPTQQLQRMVEGRFGRAP